MTCFENIAGCPQVYGEFVYFIWLEERGLSFRDSIAAPHDPVRQVLRVSFGMYIHQLGCEVCVRRTRGRIQGHRDRPGDLDILLKDGSGIHQNVFPLFHGTLIERPAGNSRRPAA